MAAFWEGGRPAWLEHRTDGTSITIDIHVLGGGTPFRGGKGWKYEGGVRVPLVVRWPAVIKPGSVVATPVSSPDHYPTLLEAVGAKPAPGQVLDGVSLLSLFRGGSLPERALFWHYPHYGNQGGAPSAAIRRGNWKLIEWQEDQRLELFDLARDPGEENDLARRDPARAEALRRELVAWQRSIPVRFPTPNPNYKPSEPSGRAVQVPAGKAKAK